MKRLILLILVLSVALAALFGCEAIPSLSDVMGSNDGTVYSSDYTGLKFSVTDNWRFMSEDEIESVTGTTQDMLDEAGNDTDVSSLGYAMVAIDDNSSNNVNVMVQVAGDSSDIDYDEILDAIEEDILKTGASIGANYNFSEHTTASLSGIKFQKFTATAEFSGITFEQGCYIAVVDNVEINITITSYDGTPIETIEAMFN